MLLEAKIADAAGASHEIFTECLRAAARIRKDAVAAFAIVGHIPFPASPRLCGASLFARPTCPNQAIASVHPRALYSGPAITDRERISGALSVETREPFWNDVRPIYTLFHVVAWGATSGPRHLSGMRRAPMRSFATNPMQAG